jgi:hypothetical protein
VEPLASVALAKKFAHIVIDRKILEKILNTHALAFTMQQQIFSNWCWSANAVSVSKFYTLASAWTQCTLASAELNINSCCNSPLPNGCNVYGYLNTSLARVNHFNRYESASATTWAMVKAEIIAGRPIGARSAWSGGGAHFMTIYGYQEYGGEKYLMIDDPIYGKTTITLATFKTAYKGSGTWTHTYYTK